MTNKTVEGVVMVATEKQVNTARGPSTVYSAKVNEGTGEAWYNFGFKNPNLTQNQQVKFVASTRVYTNAQGVEVTTWEGDSNTVQAVKTAEAAAPAVMAKAVVSVDNRQRSIVLQSAYQRAIMIATAAVENDLLTLGTKKADKFDVFCALIDDLALGLAEKFIDPPASFVAPAEDTIVNASADMGDDEYAVV